MVFVGYYLPGYKAGGPIRTIANMVELLSDDFDFYIVTADRDSMDTVSYPHLQNTSGWQEVGKAKVLYLSPKDKGFANLAKIARETPHDYLYLNSFFSYHFTIKPLLLRRFGLIPYRQVVLAPRGEFSEGALGLKSKKKSAFLFISKIFNLYKNLYWQASSEREKSDVLNNLFFLQPEDIHTAIDLPDIKALEVESAFFVRDDKQSLRIVFLSRISPMKNLDYALQVLAKLKVDIVFDIYGAANDEAYFGHCTALAGRLPSNVQWNYRGVLEHTQVVSKISEYDLFLLPTKGENFGHVILEALSAGTPALIADTTPWMDLEENNAGWVLPLSEPRRFVEVIEKMAVMPVEEQLAQREAVRAYAKKHLFNQDNIEQNKLLFN